MKIYKVTFNDGGWHSSLPNTNGRVTIRDIKAGEELTEDYSPYLISGHSLTKNKIRDFI